MQLPILTFVELFAGCEIASSYKDSPLVLIRLDFDLPAIRLGRTVFSDVELLATSLAVLLALELVSSSLSDTGSSLIYGLMENEMDLLFNSISSWFHV